METSCNAYLVLVHILLNSGQDIILLPVLSAVDERMEKLLQCTGPEF